jgi:hypothetical protein
MGFAAIFFGIGIEHKAISDYRPCTYGESRPILPQPFPEREGVTRRAQSAIRSRLAEDLARKDYGDASQFHLGRGIPKRKPHP